MLDLLTYLMRGGTYGHYWLKQSKETIWWDPSEIPDSLEFNDEDTYFGVHPSKLRKGNQRRTTLEDIEAVNCLYADIDDKDYHGTAIEHIKSLDPRPSVIIGSGSGYHLYWLLDKPLILDSPLKREIARLLQERWAPYVGGDAAVHDLARILRLPGTYNYKYDPPRPVTVQYLNLKRTYTFEQLNNYLPQEDEHRDDDEEIPAPVAPNNLPLQDLVDRAKQAKNGTAFISLWRGQTSAKYSSESEGDLALCCLLAFWTGGDYDKIDKLFRLSQRFREKWEREDYRRDTILKALGQVSNYYRDPGDLYLAGAHDEGNAQCVRGKYRNKFLYDRNVGWREYTGTHWGGELAEPHLKLKIIEVLKARQAAAWTHSGDDDDRAKQVSRAAMPSSRNIENTHRILKDILAVAGSEFDTSPDELNVKNGVVNLRSGKLRPHHHSQRFTYCLPVAYNSKANQSVWTDWLLQAVGDSQEVVDYLKTAVGYSLTGHTREETMFYLWGPTRAGKGIFTETLLALLGYAPLGVEVNIRMFMVNKGQDVQGFALAGLRAARFLATSETKSRTWMDGSRLKNLTGGNIIRCAHKGKPFFEYLPKFKIWMTSNYPPRLDADDAAAWNRIRVIKFPTSHLQDIDKHLKGRMRQPSVLAGVLAWVVEGAMQWYTLPQTGLKAPQSVTDDTAETREQTDQVAAWLRERLMDTGSNDDKLSYADAYADYQVFCQENGEQYRPRKHWKASLVEKGFNMRGVFAVKRNNGTLSTQRGWTGKKLVGGFRVTITGGNNA